MSAERDLLRRAKCLLECSNMEPLQRQSENIVEGIKELLAQPKREPLSDTVSKLRNLRDIQGTKGTYDYDEYMRGLFNGLELALSLFEDRAPDYKEYIKPTEQEGVYQKILRIEDGIEVEILPSELWLDGYETGRKDPQKRKPLSCEVIDELTIKSFYNGVFDFRILARAIEEEHGITGVDNE